VTSPTQVTLRVICDIDKFRGGDTVYLAAFGPSDGVWLIGERRRSVFQPYSDLTLVQAMQPINASSGLALGVQYQTGPAASKPGAGTVIAAMISEAATINNDDYQYRWGGGHPQAGTPSVGEVGGPAGSAGPPPGFDCSGAVAAVLVAGGLWQKGAPVGGDASIPAALLGSGNPTGAPVAVPSSGSGTPEVTIYDCPGVHIFMRINGEIWGTADGSGHLPATPNQGAGWIPNGVPGGPGFTPIHIRQDVLGQSATAVASSS
jgi:hypothetical protein